MILWTTINQTTRIIPASNTKISKNKINKKTQSEYTNLGFWKSEIDSNQQNPNLFVTDMEIYERVEDDQRGAGVVLQP
jgi:hypothetical protein